MQEFSSISVSSYEAAALADRLTEQSAEGWAVVAIVPAGSTVTAYLSRPSQAGAEVGDANVSDASDSAAAATDTDASATPDVLVAEVPSVPDAPAVEASASPEVPVAAATGWAATDASTPEPAATPAAAPAGAAAPPGWYADPAARFELRYWDGGQWTEHVSRAGQQFTDPPVA